MNHTALVNVPKEHKRKKKSLTLKNCNDMKQNLIYFVNSSTLIHTHKMVNSESEFQTNGQKKNVEKIKFCITV